MRKAFEMLLIMMCSFPSHQVVNEMCVEIVQQVHKAATLANDITEDIIISQVHT